MTVRTVIRPTHYYGVSGDAKPSNPPIGSTFFETNTNARYVYDGATWTASLEAVSGAVAAGTTDSGNPVKVGGIASSPTTPIAVASGQRVNEIFDLYGRPQTTIAANNGTVGSDAVAIVVFPFEAGSQNVSGARSLAVANSVFNGTAWDRLRNNVASTGLASAARTASTPTSDQTNYNGRGAKIFLDITGTPNNTETLQLTLEEKDPVSGKYVQIAAFTALTASALGASPTTETYIYEIGAGIAETIAVAKHEIQALLLSRTWRVNVLHSAAGSWAYSVGLVNLV